jgi:hypothetical protein
MIPGPPMARRFVFPRGRLRALPPFLTVAGKPSRMWDAGVTKA